MFEDIHMLQHIFQVDYYLNQNLFLHEEESILFLSIHLVDKLHNANIELKFLLIHKVQVLIK